VIVQSGAAEYLLLGIPQNEEVALNAVPMENVKRRIDVVPLVDASRPHAFDTRRPHGVNG
jgi:hypothetical protein